MTRQNSLQIQNPNIGFSLPFVHGAEPSKYRTVRVAGVLVKKKKRRVHAKLWIF